MRIAVTGGTGMLGRYVVEALIRPGGDGTQHQLVVLDRVAGPPRDGVRYLVGDVQDLGQVIGAVAGATLRTSRGLPSSRTAKSAAVRSFAGAPLASSAVT